MILFMLSALLLLGVQGITLYDRFARSSEVGLDNQVWVFAQLEVEAKNFSLALLAGLVAAGDEATDEELERQIRSTFDIYYSRTTTVSSVAKDAFKDADVLVRFEQLLASSQKIASQLDAKPRLAKDDIRALHEAFSADAPFIRKVANSAMLDSISMAEEDREARHWIVGQLQLLLGLVIMLMIASVSQAMKVSRSVSHHAAETAKIAARLRRTLKASLDAVVIVNAEGRITEHNAALGKILKQDRDENIDGFDVMRLVASDDRKAIVQLIRRLRQEAPVGASEVGAAQRINATILNATGAICPVELSCAVDQSPDGDMSYIVFVRDRSQEVAAADVLRDARDQARMDAKAKERFLSVLSHEMRTPLHGVITALELISLGEVKASEQGFLLTASACAKSALTQIDDVLALTRNGYLGDPDEAFLPSKLIDEIVTEIVPLALERGNKISFVAIGNAKTTAIQAKSRSFKLAVRNLISNAVKYTSNGEIEVVLSALIRPDGGIGLEVSIRDTGIGIRPEDQARIFDEFAMVGDQGPGGASGFGLGLAIAKSSVERLQGSIGLESELGKGSRFSFTFEAPGIEKPTAAALPDLATLSAPDPAETPLHILIVDDNPVNRALMSEMVLRLGHLPDMAMDGMIALSMAREKTYDMILMDLSMPGLNGFETALRMRRESVNKTARIFALTARDLSECGEDLRNAGFDGAYQKPIGMLLLHDIVTQSVPAEAADPLAADHSVLDGFQDVLGLMGHEMTRKLAHAMLEDTVQAQRALASAGHSAMQDTAKIESAHRAGGSAAVLGAARLAKAWRMVETALRTNDTVRCDKLAAAIPEYFEQTLLALTMSGITAPEPYSE